MIQLTDYSVRLHNVSKTYRTADVVVNALVGISFTLKKGQFVAIVGPSGSGKSTLMNILGTIDKPTHGEVYIDGVPTVSMNGDQLAEFRNTRLGFVFQAFNLINGMSAEKNVELPLMASKVAEQERKSRVSGLLDQLGINEKLMLLKPTQLSGGQQQRVAIARALVNNPSLILADEPTGNLDSVTGAEVIRLLNRVSKKDDVTIVMVTHNMETARYCDRVIHIKDGRIEKDVMN